MRVADLYVDILPTAGTLDKGLRKELAQAQKKAKVDVRTEVDSSGVKQLAGDLGGLKDRKVSVELDVDDSGLDDVDGSKAGEKVGRQMGDGIGGTLGKLGKTGGPIGLGVSLLGASLGGLLIKGISDGFAANSSEFSFRAATGLSPRAAEKFASAAGESYASAFGESVEANLDTAKAALASGLLDPRDTERRVEKVVSSLLQISDTLDLDVTEAARAAGQMVRTGLADNAEEAFDVIVKGSQEGLNASGDLLEVFTEYGTQFRKLGFDGPRALGLINQMVKAGARDTDVAADAIKEFSIRSIDGSEAVTEAYGALGLNAREMTDQIAAGGPAARKAFGTVVAQIQKIKDPAERSRVQVALFGTQAEDLGGALNALNPKQLLAVKGATKGLLDTIGQDPAVAVEEAKRSIGLAYREVAGTAATALAPAITRLSSFISENRALVVGLLVDAGDALFGFAAGGQRAVGDIIAGLGDLAAIGGEVAGAMAGLAETTLQAAAAAAALSGNFGEAKRLYDLASGAGEAADSLREMGRNAQEGSRKARDGLYEAADATDTVREEFNELGRQVKADARYNDATNRLTRVTKGFATEAVKAGRKSKGLAAITALLGDRTSELGGDLEDVQGAFQRQIKAAQESGASGKELKRITDGYRGSLKRTFREMGLNAKQAERLADKYDGVPREIKTKADFLKERAEGDTRSYREYVNAQLGGIRDEPVNINVKAAAAEAIATIKGMFSNLFATGGAVRGPGTGTSDSIPARLSNNEHVWTAKEVAGAGGHSAVEQLRRQAVRGFATGGRVQVEDVYVKPRTDGDRFSVDPVTRALNNAAGRVEGAAVARLEARLTAGLRTRAKAEKKKRAAGAIPKGNGRFSPVAPGYGLTQGLHDQYTGYPSIDIGTPTGTPVASIAAGRVSTSTQIAGSYGSYIKVNHGGFSSLYAHLSGRSVGAGQAVKGGQRIGYTGNTGNSTGPHLHFGTAGANPYSFYDKGGYLQPGMTLAANATKKPEAVLTDPQWSLMERMIGELEARTSGGSGGPVALTITNWREGTGYIEQVAAGEVSKSQGHVDTIRRMRS